MGEQKIVYIIGAGISGLIAAYELEKKGYFPIIIEKSNEVGGRVKTIKEKGYALDLGFQVILTAYPLVKKYLDLDSLNLCKLESGALIYTNGSSYRIGDPSRNWKLLIPTLIADIGSIKDKLKILKLNNKLKVKSIEEIFNSPETTTYEYLLNFGFSKKIIDRFFQPFFAGIFLESDLKTSSRMFEFVYKMFGNGYATIPKLGIGEISKQLSNKLQNTRFIFNSEVKKVKDNLIVLSSGNDIPHNGVIVTSNHSSLIDDSLNFEKNITDSWKGCICYYFDVDKTNIPTRTIALVSDNKTYINNLYAYKDHDSGRNILSVTVLKNVKIEDEKEVTEMITSEIKNYTGAKKVKYIHHYRINKALPDLHDLKSTYAEGKSKISENIFLAGDSLLNGSLNAAMESGVLAANDVIRDKGNFASNK